MSIDSRLRDTRGVGSHEGAGAWRISVEGWFSSLGNEQVRVTFDDVKIAADSGFASMSAIVTYSGLSADGQVLRAMQNRISMTVNTVDSWACDAQKHAFAGTDRAIRSAGRSAAHPAFSV